LTYRKDAAIVNREIKDIASWATRNEWTVVDDMKGYTRFYTPDGDYVARYPATPSNPRRRMADLITKLKKAGLEWPAPSKKVLRARR